MTKRQSAQGALNDLRAVVTQARDVMEEIRFYWREDAVLSRTFSRNSEAFAKSASELLQNMQEVVDGAKEDEKTPKASLQDIKP